MEKFEDALSEVERNITVQLGRIEDWILWTKTLWSADVFFKFTR